MKTYSFPLKSLVNKSYTFFGGGWGGGVRGGGGEGRAVGGLESVDQVESSLYKRRVGCSRGLCCASS